MKKVAFVSTITEKVSDKKQLLLHVFIPNLQQKQSITTIQTLVQKIYPKHSPKAFERINSAINQFEPLNSADDILMIFENPKGDIEISSTTEDFFIDLVIRTCTGMLEYILK